MIPKKPVMERARIMRTLALAPESRLIELMENLGDLPAFEYLRTPQKGLVMIRATSAGDELPFNLGEALVTRCSVAVNGFQGHAYILGDDPEKCLAAALADALAQDVRYQMQIENIVQVLESDLRSERTSENNKIKDTRVEFFTLVRGEDAD
ncbi:MAG: phosphonate C-P lyase system protein PhnG [Deltaproteobacteria bacterium]|jgi:alpha-D-ribose 1-methylphosphonate 5-triphosphate synthase subunit PhnG|nr:phosphonate C-P lyase system protein PhnG [Deltaproteobacteria bacterium]